MAMSRILRFPSVISSSFLARSSIASFPFPPTIRSLSLRDICPRRLSYLHRPRRLIQCAVKLGDEDFQPDNMWKVLNVEATSTPSGLPKVSVTLSDPEGIHHSTAFVGRPLGAAFKAVSFLLNEPGTIIEYGITNAITVGPLEFIITVRVDVRRGDNVVSGVGVGRDILYASVDAFLQALCK